MINLKILGKELKYNGFDIWHKGNLDHDSLRKVQQKYVTTTAAAEGYYRIAAIPMTAQYKNAMFKIKAYTSTGTTTESTVIINLAYYSGNYGSQGSAITCNTSHSYNSSTNAENGFVLLYCRLSFDGNFGYIDFYKYKTTIVTIEVEPLIESDWIFTTGNLTVNQTVGSYRNTSVTMQQGLQGTNISAAYAGYTAYSQYGVLGTNTLSNTTDKTGQWIYFGNWYFEYASSYLRGRSGNIRIRIQELSFNGSKNPDDLDDFSLIIKVGLPYHANTTEFNTVIPTIRISIDGKTSLSENDICGLVFSSGTSSKYIRFYIKLKEGNTVYTINPEQRYGRSFATSSYSQTTSYSYFNYAGDQAPISTLPSPVQGNIVYAVKKTIDINDITNFSDNVKATLLSGLNATTNAAITVSDNILTALGKLQKQIIDHLADAVKHITSTERTNWNSAKTHADSSHAPLNAQKNSDITKAEIEAKLTGTITTHNHTVTKSDVGLGNVTNESKATMFSSPDFTGTPTAPTQAAGNSSTRIATTAFVQTALPTKLSQLQNDIGAGGGINIVVSPTQPSISTGDWWFQEL